MEEKLHEKWLWQEIRYGNEEALNQLYMRVFDGLFRFGIQVMRDRSQTLQYIDEVFIDIWIKQKRLPEVENVQGYLFIIFRRKVFHHLKVLSTSKTVLTMDGQEDVQEDSYEEILIALQTTEEMRIRVSGALQKLTGRQKELIRMRYYDELPLEEISRKAGISLRTVYNTLHNAIVSLREELDE
jgi:RNA polymerase sigma-70 factor (ECF subfamily)